MNYEEIIEEFYGEKWHENETSKNGGLGIAIFLSFLRGKVPNIYELAKDIDIDEMELDIPFYRLLASGLFSKSFNARNDPELLQLLVKYKIIRGKKNDNGFDLKQDYNCAWSHIAGIAAGDIQRNIPKYKVK